MVNSMCYGIFRIHIQILRMPTITIIIEMFSLNDKIFHKDAVDPKTVTMHLNALVKTAKALLNVVLNFL